jgi:hypothetical protein
MAAGVCFLLSEHSKHPSPATAFPVPGFFPDLTMGIAKIIGMKRSLKEWTARLFEYWL